MTLRGCETSGGDFCLWLANLQDRIFILFFVTVTDPDLPRITSLFFENWFASSSSGSLLAVDCWLKNREMIGDAICHMLIMKVRNIVQISNILKKRRTSLTFQYSIKICAMKPWINLKFFCVLLLTYGLYRRWLMSRGSSSAALRSF